MRGMKISQETIEMMVGNLRDVAEKLDQNVEILVDPSSEKIAKIAKDVDYLLTDQSGLPSQNIGDVGAVNIATASNLIHQTGFRGTIEFGKYLAWKLQKEASNPSPSPHRKLIASRFDYEEGYYPMIKDPMCSSSRKMWSDIWC